jgi:hypothetical protein
MDSLPDINMSELSLGSVIIDDFASRDQSNGHEDLAGHYKPETAKADLGGPLHSTSDRKHRRYRAFALALEILSTSPAVARLPHLGSQVSRADLHQRLVLCNTSIRDFQA